MSRYHTPSLFIFSTLGGVVTFLILITFNDWPLSLLFAAIATLLISIAIPVMFYISDRKFTPLKKEIGEPILIDERVSYVVGEELRLGFMVATKSSIFVISVENEKPIKFEIKKSDIKKISVSDDVYLNIFLDYDKCIRVFGTNCEELSSMLAKEGFGK